MSKPVAAPHLENTYACGTRPPQSKGNVGNRKSIPKQPPSPAIDPSHGPRGPGHRKVRSPPQLNYGRPARLALAAAFAARPGAGGGPIKATRPSSSRTCRTPVNEPFPPAPVASSTRAPTPPLPNATQRILLRGVAVCWRAARCHVVAGRLAILVTAGGRPWLSVCVRCDADGGDASDEGAAAPPPQKMCPRPPPGPSAS